MTDRELDRRAAHRMAVIRHAQEVTGNVSKTCRYNGITWLRRYEAGGIAALRDRSSRPYVSPTATQAEVVGKIVYLRQTYHFGPHKIAMYLAIARPIPRLAPVTNPTLSGNRLIGLHPHHSSLPA
jgi:Homeodomain-like domain